jgi:cytochrome c-type biogenesis protein CcmH/NrfF
VDEYGVKILAAPPKRGFFLTAWLTPLMAILLGGIAVLVLLRQWARPGGKGRPGEAPAPLSSEQQALAARFEAELRERA